MHSLADKIKSVSSIYSNDKIFILGKGASADLVSTEFYNGSLVIAINDAERIAPADITIFYEQWVQDAVKSVGYKSQLYITPFPDFLPEGRQAVCAAYVPFNQKTSEFVMSRLMGASFFIEEILFLSALRIARMLSEIRGRRQTVYFVGFDFDPSVGYSQSLGHDYAPDRQEERAIRISIQEFYFLNALYFLKDSNISINHVGTRSFSMVTAAELNNEIGGRKKHQNSRHAVSIVAELTTNHFGDRARLESLIRASKAAGADFIKLQKRNVESFYSKEQLASPYQSPFGKTFADYRFQIELDYDDFLFVDDLCRSIGIGWFSSALDKDSLHFLMDMGLDMIKFPSTISEHKDYLSYAAAHFQGDAVLSTGMTDESYERFVMQAFVNCKSLYLLQCNSAYPTPLVDCNIAVIRRYHEMSKRDERIVPGYSSHDFGWKASILAVAAGARMVEKHVKMGNTEWAHFDAVAIDLSTPEFRVYIDHIREAELIVGSEIKKINESEIHKYFKGVK